MSATDSKYSRCTGATIVTTPISGCAIFASAVISPACDMPISMTATSCSGCSFRSMSGKTEMIVEVSFRLEHAETAAEDVRDGFLGGRLARRTRDAHDWLSPKPPNGGGQRLQGDEGVVDREQAGLHREAGQLILAHDRGDGAAFQRLMHEVVAVEALALDREEEFAGLNCARIDRIAGRHLFQFAFPGGAEELFDACQGQLHAFCPAPAVAVRHS